MSERQWESVGEDRPIRCDIWVGLGTSCLLLLMARRHVNYRTVQRSTIRWTQLVRRSQDPFSQSRTIFEKHTIVTRDSGYSIPKHWFCKKMCLFSKYVHRSIMEYLRPLNWPGQPESTGEMGHGLHCHPTGVKTSKGRRFNLRTKTGEG